ncbi:MAG: hypothetical protein RQ783_00245 [Gammaproteobacteria bacterium]|nr:hypothetical protein [Gammaproteobacteria bacterium]
MIATQPIITTLSQAITVHPPTPPTDRSAILQVIIWSIKLRYWAYQNTPDSLFNKNRIRLHVNYHQAKENQALEHSLGLQKGLIGIVHAFADPKQNAQNAIVMTHEILHTIGAIDKYDRFNLPTYPDGYADPNKVPL